LARQGRLAGEPSNAVATRQVSLGSVDAPGLTDLAGALLVLGSGEDPLVSAFERSTISRAGNRSGSSSLGYMTGSQLTSANATTPSSPKPTPGQQLLDFKQDLKPDGNIEEDPRWLSAGSRHRQRLTCAMMVIKNEGAQGIVGKGVERAKAGPSIITEPTIRGNTVSSYWALCREVRSVRKVAPRIVV